MAEAAPPGTDPSAATEDIEPGGHIEGGLAALTERRRRLVRERRAFLEFANRLCDMGVDPVDSTSGPSSPGSIHDRPRGVGPGFDAATEAYRETVLAISHIDEYGGSLATHMESEFGTDVTAAFFENKRLTRQLRDELVSQSEKAVRRRDVVADCVEEERRRLSEAGSRFESIRADLGRVLEGLPGASFAALQARHRRIADIERRVHGVMGDRQDAIGGEGLTLNRYFYRDLGTIDPVLSDGMATLTIVRDVKRLIVRSITARA